MAVKIISILVSVIIVLVLFIIYESRVNKNLKEQNKRKTEQYNRLQNEFYKYRESESYKYHKREEVNEKVNDIHSGKLSADDILPKR